MLGNCKKREAVKLTVNLNLGYLPQLNHWLTDCRFVWLNICLNDYETYKTDSRAAFKTNKNIYGSLWHFHGKNYTKLNNAAKLAASFSIFKKCYDVMGLAL